jgi:hypothetical protein
MISYENIYNYSFPGDGTPGALGDIHRFRRVERTGFNATDTVDVRFFKLLFYFINDEQDPTTVDWFNGGSSGLLTPTWLDNPSGDYYKYNSAWAYLKSNYEEERADALVHFINLLSQISSESPWYFQSVSGVDEALAREKWSVSEERKKISIKCLNDPADHRIESLLSLYRSIVWSHSRKCEVLPANLRKFDMGMFVFSGLFRGLVVGRNNKNQADWAPIGTFNENTDRGNYKYLEFHNCEISMDSIKSGFGEMSNESGFEQGFTIDIYFDDCYEHEFNPFVMRSFGDFFVWDAWVGSGRSENGDTTGDPSNPFENASRVESMETNMLRDITGRVEGVVPPLTFTFGNPQNQESSSTEVGNINKSSSTKPDTGFIGSVLQQTQNVLDRAGENASRIATQAADSARGTARSALNSVANGITGGLGNIYGKGGGLQGAVDAISQEVSQQIKSLANKVSGNISDTASKASKAITQGVTAPILGTIKKTSNSVADAADTVNNRVIAGFNDSTGTYTRGESEDLGNIYYGNQIGKNRLNTTKLGKL